MAKRKYTHKKYSRKKTRKYSRKKYSRKKTKNYSRKKYHKKRKYSKRRKYQRGGVNLKELHKKVESGVRRVGRSLKKTPTNIRTNVNNMAESAAKRFLERKDFKDMKEKFQKMDPEELKMRARIAGATTDEIEMAMKSGDGNDGIVELIFKTLPEYWNEGFQEEVSEMEKIYKIDRQSENMGKLAMQNQMKIFINEEENFESFGMYGVLSKIKDFGTPEQQEERLFSERGFDAFIKSDFSDPADKKNYSQNDRPELKQRVLRYLPLWKSLKGHPRPFKTIPDYCFVNNERGYPVFREEFVAYVKDDGLTIEEATKKLEELDNESKSEKEDKITRTTERAKTLGRKSLYEVAIEGHKTGEPDKSKLEDKKQELRDLILSNTPEYMRSNVEDQIKDFKYRELKDYAKNSGAKGLVDGLREIEEKYASDVKTSSSGNWDELRRLESSNSDFGFTSERADIAGLTKDEDDIAGLTKDEDDSDNNSEIEI